MVEHTRVGDKDKLQYTTPELKRLGTVDGLTQGAGSIGTDDQFWFFTWGSNNNVTGS